MPTPKPTPNVGSKSESGVDAPVASNKAEVSKRVPAYGPTLMSKASVPISFPKLVFQVGFDDSPVEPPPPSIHAAFSGLHIPRSQLTALHDENFGGQRRHLKKYADDYVHPSTKRHGGIHYSVPWYHPKGYGLFDKDEKDAADVGTEKKSNTEIGEHAGKAPPMETEGEKDPDEFETITKKVPKKKSSEADVEGTSKERQLGKTAEGDSEPPVEEGKEPSEEEPQEIGSSGGVEQDG